MMRRRSAVVLISVVLAVRSASAHRIDEYLQATLLTLETDRVVASMRMIPGVLAAPSVIAVVDIDRDGRFSEAEQRTYAQHVVSDLAILIDSKVAQPTLTSWTLPQPEQLRDGLGEIHIAYALALPRGGAEHVLRVENKHLSASSVYLVNVVAPDADAATVVGQSRNERQSVYELRFQRARVQPSSWADVVRQASGSQLPSLFQLGLHHIAEGTDHLLFLLVLLLPAPLLASNSRWGGTVGVHESAWRILRIVTAFTIGHSITLSLAALHVVHVSSRPVEVLIALSIFASALHALRPMFAGREAFVAGFFGLVHGLAFATTLERLGLARWDRVLGILSFNVGIEAMQMIVVAALLPSLLLMSRTRVYPSFRMTGAVLALTASGAWTLERVFGTHTPIDQILSALAHHGVAAAALLLLLSLACKVLFPSAVRTCTLEHSRAQDVRPAYHGS